MKCPACAVENKDTAKFCKGCGAVLAQPATEAMLPATCKSRSDCGFFEKPNAKFCPKCGELNPSLAATVPQKIVPQESSPVAVPAAQIESTPAPVQEIPKITVAPTHSRPAEVHVDSPVAPSPIRGKPVADKPTSKRTLIVAVIVLSVAALAGGGVYYYKFSGAASHAEVGNSANANAPVITLPGNAAPQLSPEAAPAQPVISPQPAPAAPPAPPAIAPQPAPVVAPPQPVIAPQPSAKPAHPAAPARGETAADRATLDKINNAIDNLGKNK